MIQNVGIQFEAKGVEGILESFDKIDKRITETANKFMALASQLSTLGKVAPGFKELDMAMGSLSGKTQTTAKAMGSLSANTHSAIQGAEKLKNVSNQLIGGGKGGGFGGLGAALPYMIQWRALSGAIEAGKYLATDILAGGSREKMAGALGELSAVGFDKQQKGMAERSARDYTSKFYDTSAVDVVKAMSQTASAYSVEKLGVSMISRMNEAAMNAAKLSKMPEEAMAEVLSKFTNSYLSSMDKATYKALQSGERANVRGYGNVNIAEMYEKTSAMLAKTIEVSNIWGKQVGEFMQYAAPVMAQRGWDPGTMMAYAGVMSDLGFKGQKSGRAMKDTLMGSADDFARLMLYSERGFYEKKGQIRKPPDSDVRGKSAEVNRMMSDPDKFLGFLERMTPLMRQAFRDTQTKGLDLTKDFGFSKDFMPQLLAILNEGALERLREFMTVIRDATYEDVLRKRTEQLDDTGLTLTRLKNAWDGLVQGIAASSTGVTRALGGLADAFDYVAKKIGIKNEQEDMNKMLSKQLATRQTYKEMMTKRGRLDEIGGEEKYDAATKAILEKSGQRLLDTQLKESLSKVKSLPKNFTPEEKSMQDAEIAVITDKHMNSVKALKEHYSGILGPAPMIPKDVTDLVKNGLSLPINAAANVLPTDAIKDYAIGKFKDFSGMLPKNDDMSGLDVDERRRLLAGKMNNEGTGDSEPKPINAHIYLDGKSIWNAIINAFTGDGTRQFGMGGMR